MDYRILKNKEKYEGKKYKSRCGHVAKIIEYHNTHNVEVEYESGHKESLKLRSIKDGYFRDKTLPSVLGVGINDADYVTQPTVNGKRLVCPFYRMWKNMLTRCYDEEFKKKPQNKTYVDCVCAEEWLRFSNFKTWVESFKYKNYTDKVLDKDLLFVGNKVYSPETCVIIPEKLNYFMLSSNSARGKYPIGVSWKKAGPKNRSAFTSICNDPTGTYSHFIGYFDTPMQAHKAWQKRKHELACKLADEQSDQRVAKALRERYAPDKDWSKV